MDFDWAAARHGLVVAPSWIGDAVMCLPALAELRRRWPACALTVHARPPVAAVFAAAGLGLDVVTAPAPRGFGLGALRRMAATRRRGDQPAPDFALVLPNSWYAALTARALGARARIGYARGGRTPLLTHAVPEPWPGETPAHEAFFYLELLRRAGAIGALPPVPEAPLTADPARLERWNAQLPGTGLRRVALHVGASYGTAKRWLPERFAALAAALAARECQVLFIGTAAERALAEATRLQAVRQGGGTAEGRLANLAGQTTPEDLLAVLALCDLVVANDSGPMHLAAALGTPLVAIFGATNEQETSPLARPGRLALLKAPGVECSPCKLRECPIDHRCMTRIEVAEALAAAERMLAVPR